VEIRDPAPTPNILGNVESNRDTTDFVPLPLRALRIDSTLPFDLYIRVGDEYVLYRSRTLPFLKPTLDNLLTHRVDSLHAPAEAATEVAHHFELHFNQIPNDRDVPVVQRAHAVAHVAENLARDIIFNPEVFDCLTSAQPYRGRMNPGEAFRGMLEEMRGKLDARLVRQLVPGLLRRDPAPEPEEEA